MSKKEKKIKEREGGRRERGGKWSLLGFPGPSLGRTVTWSLTLLPAE
jgi:hypothetical protein